MNPAEARAYNRGVGDVLKIARDAAEAINRTSQRPVHEAFAVAALAELVEAGKGLFVAIDRDPPDVITAADPTTRSPSPMPVAADVEVSRAPDPALL